jgi:DNA-binding NarL/FixJ family response regulator
VHTIEEVKHKEGQLVYTLLYKRVYAVEDSPLAMLSSREVDVLQQIALGYSSKQVAECLHLSTYTVSNHRKNMLRKTGCKSSTELLNYALKHGYL